MLAIGHFYFALTKVGNDYLVNDPWSGERLRSPATMINFTLYRGPIPQPDTTKPVTSISFSGTVGDNYWYKSYVTMNLTATDNQSGVATTQWSYDGASWVTYSGAVALSKTGLEVPVYFRSIDNAGNVEDTKVARYNSDPFPPLNPTHIDSRCGALSGVWQNTCPSPNFLWSGASDSLSGLAGYEYYWGTNPSAASGTYITVNNYAPPPPGQGEVYLRIRTKDRAGNFSNWQTVFTYRYDSDVPYGSLNINNGATITYMTLVNANLSATDSLSGVSQYRLRNANGVWGQWHPMSADGLWKLPELNRSNHKVEVQYQDKAGNVSGISSKSIWLELYPPKPVSNFYILGKSTMGAAGVVSGSENYQMMGTLTQPSIIGSGETETLSSDWGYWTRVRFISQPWLTNFLPLVVR